VRDARHGRSLYLLAAIPPIVAMITVLLAPDPHGHWSEHLSGAGLKGAQLALLLVLLTMLGWRTLSVALLLAFAVTATGMLAQVLGDVQVADSIWRTSGDPGSGDGYEEGHDTSGLGDLLVFLGGIAFAIVAGVTRRVPVKLAVLAAVLTIIPPPFFWPAVGVLVLVLYGLTSRSRLLPRTASATSRPR
jgi:hypothetical protein